MAASGFAGLGYQIVWTQQFALGLGHESAAMLAVVAAFFGGLAAGAWSLGGLIERSPRPRRWYASCEALIAGWTLLLSALMPRLTDVLLDGIGLESSAIRQWALTFGGTLILLLPATAAMGGTLPAIERITASARVSDRSIAGHYAANTLGAVTGVLTTAFWLLPELGLALTTLICATLNGLCALSALRLFPRTSQLGPSDEIPETRRARGALLRLAITGLLGIGYEVLVVRVLSQVSENTVYTFSVLLAVYLAATALGAATYQRWRLRCDDFEALGEWLLIVLAAACLAGTASLWGAESVKAWMQNGLGSGATAAILAEGALALPAFGPPAFLMGALFSHLGASARRAGVSFGRSLGVNTLGAALAPVLFGLMLAAALGPKMALLVIPPAYLVLAAKPPWRNPWVIAPAVPAVALALWGPPLAFVEIPEGGTVISYQDGVTAAVSVVEDAEGTARLRINNRQQEGSSATLLVDGRQALLPLLLHLEPRRALFLGLGTGVTASTAAEDPSLAVDAVELLPEVIEASAHFRRPFAEGAPNPRLHLIAADARRYVKTSTSAYDVVVADNFHPARSGSGALYTVEHFRAVRARLAPGGLFCQWLPLHQMDLETLRSIVRSFLEAFPGGWAMLASNSLETPVLGLVGRGDDRLFEIAEIRKRLGAAAFPRHPAEFGIEDEFALLGSFVAGPSALVRFAGSAPANTDDRPVVAYRAPFVTYAPDSLPRDRLIALLEQLAVEPAEVLNHSAEPDWSRRMNAYWTARNRFIQAGRAVRPSADVKTMLKQVREPLLLILRISPDFRPAYDPLLRMAGALGRVDPPGARALLEELARIQPQRPEARMALGQIADIAREESMPRN